MTDSYPTTDPYADGLGMPFDRTADGRPKVPGAGRDRTLGSNPYGDPFGPPGGGVPGGDPSAPPPPAPTEDPWHTAARFHAAYGGMPAHQVVAQSQAGTPVQPYAGTAATGAGGTQPTSTAGPTPQQAGTMNAQFPGFFNGDPANGYPKEEAGFTPQPGGHHRGGRPSWATDPTAPPPETPAQLQARLAPPQTTPAPVATTPPVTPPTTPPVAPPAGTSQAPTAGDQAYSDAMLDFARRQSLSAPGAAPQTAPAVAPTTTPDASAAPTVPLAAAPQPGMVPQGETAVVGRDASAPAPGAAASTGATSYTTASGQPFTGTPHTSSDGTVYDDTYPDGWASRTPSQQQTWKDAHRLSQTASDGSSAPGTEPAPPPPLVEPAPGTTTTQPGDANNGSTTPPNGDTTTTPTDGSDPSLDPSLDKSGASPWNDLTTYFSSSNPNANPGILAGYDLWTKGLGLSQGAATANGALPAPGKYSASQAAGHQLVFTGTDLPMGAFTANNPDYVTNSAVRTLLSTAFGYASQVQLLQSGTGTEIDPATLKKYTDKLNTALTALSQYGIQYQPFGGSHTGSGQADDFGSIWNSTDLNQNATQNVPGSANILSPAVKRAFNITGKSTPTEIAAAVEAQNQIFSQEVGLHNQNLALGNTAAARDLYHSSAQRTASEKIAADMAANPDPVNEGLLENKTVEESDASLKSYMDAASASAARRGISTDSQAGIAGDINRAHAGDLSSRLGDLRIQAGERLRAGQQGALTANNDVFNTYTGGEARMDQALSGIQMGQAPSPTPAYQGVGGAAANLQALDIAQQQADNAKTAADKANTLGYVTAFTSLLGSGVKAGAL